MPGLLFAFPLQSADAPEGRVTEYALPTSHVSPQSLTIDQQGRIWYTALTANLLGVFDPATEEFTEYKIPTRNARPFGLVADEKGRIWFTQNGNGKIGRFDPRTGRFREYFAPSAKDLHTPVFDQKGYLWFTARRSNKIGRFNPKTYNLGEFRVPTPNSQPTDIAVSPERILWFTEFNGNKLGRLDPAMGEITEVALPTAEAGPLDLAVDDTYVWLTENTAGKIARYNYRTGEWKEWDSPSGTTAQPRGITLSHDGSVWYAESATGQMVHFDPGTEEFTTYPLPTPESRASHIIHDGNGTLWLAVSYATEAGKNSLARLD
jgi:virginiamycin B lyase